MSPELSAELLKVLDDQAKLITKLVNENIEQENMINTLMSEELPN